MTHIRSATITALVWVGTASQTLAQQMNPAPPIRETAPAGSNATAVTLAATDFNWVWVSLVVILVAFAVWYAARLRQSGNPR